MEEERRGTRGSDEEVMMGEGRKREEKRRGSISMRIYSHLEEVILQGLHEINIIGFLGEVGGKGVEESH